MTHGKPTSLQTWTAVAALALLYTLCGCSQWSKPKWIDFSSMKPPRPNASTVIKDKPLSNTEQRKLCIATAEQLAQSQHWEEAVQLYQKAESLGKPGQSLDRELAPALAACGRFPEAIERYHRLTEKNPNDADLIVNFAWTLMEAGEPGESEQLLKSLLQRNPRHELARMNLATLLARSGRTDEAFTEFQQVVGESAAHHNIGVIALEMGQIELARNAFAKASSGSESSTQSQQFLLPLPTHNRTPASRARRSE